MTKAASSENVLPCAKSLNDGWWCSLDPNIEVPYPTHFSVTNIWFKTKSHFKSFYFWEQNNPENSLASCITSYLLLRFFEEDVRGFPLGRYYSEKIQPLIKTTSNYLPLRHKEALTCFLQGMTYFHLKESQSLNGPETDWWPYWPNT